MKLSRSENWYRPYYVHVNGKGYYVEGIHFYKDNDILVSSNSGWLENENGMDISEIELPIEEIKMKRKIKFDGTVFAKTFKSSYDTETRVMLYIPADMLDIHFVEYRLEHHRHVKAIYIGSQSIFISSHIKSIDGELYAIREEYEEVYKQVSDTCLAIDRGENVLDKILTLSALAERYIAERERLYKLTINDIEL